MAKKETPKSGHQPICNLEAEQSVLGAILVPPEVMDEIVDLLQPEDFYREDHRKIYRAMLGLHNSQAPVDIVTVNDYLKERRQLEGCGGPGFLMELSTQVGFATNGPFYATKVREKAILRRLLDTMQQIAAACFAPVENVAEFVDTAEQKIFEAMEDKRQGQSQSLAELVPAERTRIEALHELRGRLFGIPSGFTDLDELTAGFQNSDLIIIAARPSMGKTTLALNIAAFAADKAGVPVSFFSLEMSKEQLVRRLWASEGRIDATRLRSGRMEPQEWVDFNRVDKRLMEMPIYINDKPNPTALEIRAQARRDKKKHGVGLIIIDYLQLAQDPRARTREQEIGGISRAMKALAKELNVPVIVVSQLNREVEKRNEKRPVLADLRDSGQIEQDADVVIFIYRDEVYREDSPDRGIAEVQLAKQRNGPVGKINLTYFGEYLRFENYII